MEGRRDAGTIPIEVTLAEIVERICPECREALVSLLAERANIEMMRQAVREQVLPSPPPDGGRYKQRKTGKRLA